MRRTDLQRRLTWLAGSVLLGLLLAGCGGPTPLPPTVTMLPTDTPTITAIYIVVTATPTPTAVLPTSEPPTLTPTSPPPTLTPTPAPIAAQVCATCGGLRLRDTPGTAGQVVAFLNAADPVTVTGRTADNAWLQISTAAGQSGWVAADYLDVQGDPAGLVVAGEAVNSAATSAPAAVAVAAAAGMPVDLLNVNVVTGITARSRQIFLAGQQRGNIFNAFTRIGDSITVSGAFLTELAHPGRYDLGEYDYFQAVIRWFSGPDGRGNNPFDPPVLGAQSGWSTIDVLNPALANQSVCNPGETPIECDYRLVRPSVALIMLGTNDAGGVPTETYAANLRRIVEISIAYGVIPVLSTLPPKPYDAYHAGRIPELNQVIVTTARTYDIPLWNYWLAVQNLPNQGISADLVHPSVPPDGRNAVFDEEHLQYGYPMRNLTALQVLDQLWRQVLYDGDRMTPAPPAGAPPSLPVGGSTGETTTTDGGAPTPSGICPGSAGPTLIVGGMGRVTPGLPNKMRSQPATGAPEVGSIPGEALFSVVGGPTCADGYTWWQVNYQGVVGWTAGGSSSEAWIEPAG